VTDSAVARSEARFRQLLEGIPEAILEVTEEGRIVFVNEVAEQMFGYTRDEFLALNIDSLIPESKRNVDAQYRLGYSHQPQRRPMGTGLELNGRRKDGSLFPVEISLTRNRPKAR
jgi:PAS domain S-box-containing protein